MKNINQTKGLTVENEVIEHANLGEDIVLTATDHLIVLAKGKMSAMDMVKTIESLTDLTHLYLEVLAKNCGVCEKCGHCEDLEDEDIKLPEYLLEIAGVPTDAKLCAYVEEDSGIVRVEEADYESDITDVPKDLRNLLQNYGICMGELDALLVKGELLHE